MTQWFAADRGVQGSALSLELRPQLRTATINRISLHLPPTGR